jgi:transcriptional regulator with XRE-family HTH domain
MTIGKRLKQARKTAKMTQQMLANLSGVSQTRISGLESGLQSSSSFVPELANALGVDITWLKTGVDSKNNKPIISALELKIIELLRQLDPEELAREVAYLQKLAARKDILNTI